MHKKNTYIFFKMATYDTESYFNDIKGEKRKIIFISILIFIAMLVSIAMLMSGIKSSLAIIILSLGTGITAMYKNIKYLSHLLAIELFISDFDFREAILKESEFYNDLSLQEQLKKYIKE